MWIESLHEDREIREHGDFHHDLEIGTDLRGPVRRGFDQASGEQAARHPLERRRQRGLGQ